MQFGGHIETEETPWQAVTHELLEESGYNMSQLKILQPKQRMRKATGAKLHPVSIYHNTHEFDKKHFHTDVAYAFVVAEEPAHKVVEDELTEIKLLTREELVSLPKDQTFESVREAGLFGFDACLVDWERVDPSTFN